MAKDYAKTLKAFRKLLTKSRVSWISVSENKSEVKIITRDEGIIIPHIPTNMQRIRVYKQGSDHLYIGKKDGSQFTEEELNLLKVQYEH